MSFIPMNLGMVERPVKDAHRGDCLPLARSPLPVLPIEPPKLSDCPAGGDRLDGLQRTDDLEIHRATLPRPPGLSDPCSVGERDAMEPRVSFRASASNCLFGVSADSA